MSEKMVDYADLPSQVTWVEYLRTRLPYSFKEIREVREGASSRKRQYILSGPILSTRPWGEYHNFWQRGYVYYAVGRLIDIHDLSLYWQEYRILHTDEIRNRYSRQVDHLGRFSPKVFNALQLEKLWAPVSRDHLDRERAVMTNVIQGIEFCLKAIKTHAEYRDTGTFTFNEGHDLDTIFDSLPQTLQLDIRTASATFAEDYANFRRSIEDRISQLEKRRMSPSNFGKPPDVVAWNDIAHEINLANYTAFVNANDPASVGAVDCEPDDWFDCAMNDIGKVTYHRYAPLRGRDEYPTKPIHLGLMLGRFMYEYLFPVTVNTE